MPDHGDYTDYALPPADRAVKYLLDRIQLDADLRWLCGWGTQSFSLLCAAEAARTGETEEAVEKRRRQALSKGLPEVVDLREKLRSAEEALNLRT